MGPISLEHGGENIAVSGVALGISQFHYRIRFNGIDDMTMLGVDSELSDTGLVFVAYCIFIPGVTSVKAHRIFGCG